MARHWTLLFLIATIGVPSAAIAEQDSPVSSSPSVADAREAAIEGAFLFSTLSSTPATSALVSVLGGYDTARGTPVGSAVGEVRLWGPISLRGGAAYVADAERTRPTVGLRAQLLRQTAHGVDGTVSVFYQPEGFNEAEGEIETFVSVGRRFDQVTLIGNVVYGQDPEGNERDAELRLAWLCRLGRSTVGLDSRGRAAIGARQSPASASEPRYDLMVSSVATVVLGPFAISGQAGLTTVKVSQQTLNGVVALVGLGTAF